MKLLNIFLLNSFLENLYNVHGMITLRKFRNSTTHSKLYRYHGKILEALENEYKVQLLDEESLGIEDMIKTLPKDKIK